VTLVHFAAPFPYDDYQVIVYPLLCAVLAAEVAVLVHGRRVGMNGRMSLSAAAAVGILLLSMLAAGSSPMTWKWFVGERDRIWWPLKEQTPLQRLQAAGAFIREQSDPADLLLTQDAYLAVEAGRNVPLGLELGPFSYFPEWDDEKADACHVLNRAGMRRLLQETDAPLAAFSGYGLAVQCPEVSKLPDEDREALQELLMRRYEPLKTVASFGQAATDLEILGLRECVIENDE
jgi:hypothetical protein